MDPTQSESRRKLLTPEGLFQIVAEEAFKDGVLEGWEAKILQILARFLSLKHETAMAIAQGARQLHQQGKLGRARPLEPGTLYRKVLYFTCYDGRIEESEGQMLLALRRLFKISEEDHARLFQQVAMHFRKRSDSLSGEIDLSALDMPPPAAASPDQSWSLDAVRRATSLARSLEEGLLDERDAGDCLSLYEEIRTAVAQAERRPAALEALSILAPVLASHGRSKQITALLVETIQPEDLWRSHPDHYLKLVQGWTLPVLACQDPERLRGLQETLWGLTLLGGQEPYRWKGLAFGLFHILKHLASQRDWEAHLEVMTRFHQVPDEFLSVVAPAWAEAAADWVVLGLHGGLLYAADRGLQELKLLASYRDQPAVRRAEATALSCLLQTCSEEGALDPTLLYPALTRARDLRVAFPGDPEILRPQIVVALDLGKALLALERPDLCASFFQELGSSAEGFPDEEDLLFELTKALLATTHARLQTLPADSRSGDPLLRVLKRTMTRLREGAPGTPLVEAVA